MAIRKGRRRITPQTVPAGPPPPPDLTATGFGTAAVNGGYNIVGTYNGHNLYQHATADYWIGFDPTYPGWLLDTTATPNGASALYSTNGPNGPFLWTLNNAADHGGITATGSTLTLAGAGTATANGIYSVIGNRGGGPLLENANGLSWIDFNGGTNVEVGHSNPILGPTTDYTSPDPAGAGTWTVVHGIGPGPTLSW